jgi:hypothetical protein
VAAPVKLVQWFIEITPSSLVNGCNSLRQLRYVQRDPPRLVAGVASPCALSAPSWETDFYVKN